LPDITPEVTITDVRRSLEWVLGAMAWAETEIEAGQQRHPDAAERIQRGFLLLRPTHPLMRTQVVYRSHCRELIDRLADGEDTRPGTAAECCIALCETSMRAPLRSSAVGLYARLWRLAGLPPVELTDLSVHHEAIEGSLIDDHETWLRRKLRQDWRADPAPASGTPPSRRHAT
jgi:hypothetical protein